MTKHVIQASEQDESREHAVLDPTGVVFAPIAGGLTRQAVNRLAAAINVGLLREGDRLPAEAELSERFGIAAMTLREALAELRDAGYLETRRGRTGGTFVKPPPDPGGELLAQFAPVDHTYLAELVDHRRAITAQASALAAERATPLDLEHLEQHRAAAEAAANHLDYIRRDTRFHIDVAAASGSQRLLQEQTALEMETNSAAIASGRAPSREEIEALHRDHAALLDAIRSQDPDVARSAAAAHVDRSLDVLERLWKQPRASRATRQSESFPVWPEHEDVPAEETGDHPSVGDPLAIRDVIFAPIGGGGLAHQTVRRLEDGIRLGLLKPGERLPRESELSELLGISALTLREALANLRQAGYLETIRGRGGGTFVRRLPAPPTAGEARRIRGGLTRDKLTELTDLRTAISGEAAALAAARATPEQVARIEQLADQMLDVHRPTAFRPLDAAFHIQIAAASNSARLASAEAGLQTELSDITDGVGALLGKRAGPFLESSKREHQALAAAIAAHDGPAAREIAIGHATATRDLLTDLAARPER